MQSVTFGGHLNSCCGISRTGNKLYSEGKSNRFITGACRLLTLFHIHFPNQVRGNTGLDNTAREWRQGCRYMNPESSYQWLIVKTESGAGNPENMTWEDRLIELHLLAKRESWWDITAFEYGKGCYELHGYNLSALVG